MRLDKKKILGEAKGYFATKGYSDQSYGLAEECVDLGQKWLDTHKKNFGEFVQKDKSQMRGELKQFIKERVNYDAHNTTFIPTFIWMWILSTVISWIITKILENIMDKIDSDDNKYL